MGILRRNFLGAIGFICAYTRFLGTGGIGRIGRGVMRYIPIGFHSGLCSIVNLIILKNLRFNTNR